LRRRRFVIENTGNVTINGVAPLDSGPTFNGVVGSNSLSAFSPLTASLAPGGSQNFTATYPLSQGDIDNIAAAADPLSAIDNIATATGTPENGSLAPVDPSTTETGAAPNPLIELVKSSTPPAIVAPGENISYSFELSNTGNVTIDVPTINDPLCAVPATLLTFTSGFVSGDSGATTGSLDVGETWVFECTYPITQADINNGIVQNTATGAGQDPSGQPVTDDDSVDTPLAQTSAWEVRKSTASVPMFEGDTLVYNFEVENLGNVDISSIPVTQVEVDAGVVDNEVEVIGTVPPTAPALPVIGDDVSTPIPPAPLLSIDKSASAPTVGLGNISTATDAGDTIVYSFEVENTGNVTIDSIVVVDPGPTFGGVPGTGVWSGLTCPLTTLLPTQSVVCTATYILTQADIDAAIAAGPNSVANTAEAQGQDPDGDAVISPSDEELTSIESDPEILILKDAGAPTIVDGLDPALTDPGDTIDFTITVENTGNALLSNVLVQDTLTSVTCPATATPSGAAFSNLGDASSTLEKKHHRLRKERRLP